MIILLLLLSLLTIAQSRTFDESLNSTWRCGVFLPEPDTVGEPPLAKYFVLQNHYPADCPAAFKHRRKRGTFSNKCTELGSEWERDWADSGRGDEVCEILNAELELTDTLDVFPEGLSLGFYYNYCQEEEWKDTGARTEVRVCCQAGKYKDCQEILDELEYEDEAVTADLIQSGSDIERGSSSSSSSSTSTSEKTEELKSKLLAGGKLSEAEVAEMKTYIAGLRATVEFLTNSADQLEQQLSKQKI